MSLKKRIEEAYQKWKQDFKKLECKCPLQFDETSNRKKVAKRVKKLKDDLCKFSDEFDKRIPTINFDVLSDNTVDELLPKITPGFINKIAEIAEDDDFILFITNKINNKEKLKKNYSSEIEQFKLKYKELTSDLGEYETLIDFFDAKTAKFNQLIQNKAKSIPDKILCQESLILDTFICKIFDAIAHELDIMGEKIIAKDEDNFVRIPTLQKFFKPDKIKEMQQNLDNNKELKKLFPNVWDLAFEKLKLLAKTLGAKNYTASLIQPSPDNIKIFPKGKPLPYEVKQGNVGDCYLMATLISLAKTNPKAIEECFVGGIHNIDKKEDIELRFFRLIDLKVTSVKIIVNKKNIIAPSGIKDGALWPKLIEKAYAIYRKNGYESPFPHNEQLKGIFRKSLEGGSGSLSMFAITGKLPTSSLHSTREKFKPEEIIKTIERKLGKGKTLVCVFKDNFSVKDQKNGEKIQIKSKHEYAIVGIDKTKKYIRIINPWKSGGRTYSANINRSRTEPIREGGHIAISFNDFKKHFESIDYTSKKMGFPKELLVAPKLGLTSNDF